MKIAFGCDHAGYDLKMFLMEHLAAKGHECVDYGNDDPDDRTDDYPIYGEKVARAIADGEAEKGVLICGTGLGISLAANTVPGIRAAVCSEPTTAHLSVEHNNCQIISVGARVIGRELARDIVDAFFGAEFMGGVHERRVNMLLELEKQ